MVLFFAVGAFEVLIMFVVSARYSLTRMVFPVCCRGCCVALLICVCCKFRGWVCHCLPFVCGFGFVGALACWFWRVNSDLHAGILIVIGLVFWSLVVNNWLWVRINLVYCDNWLQCLF